MQTPITPPTTSAAAGAGASAPLPGGTGTAANLPPSLATALQNGNAVLAQVSARPQPGQLILSVAGGQTVQVQTPLPLPPGTGLAVTLQSSGPPATLHLQPQAQGQSAGQTGAQPQSATAQSAASPSAAAGTSAPSVVTTLTQGSILTATVTGPASGAASQATISGAPTTSASGVGAQATNPGTAPPGSAAAATAGSTAAVLPPGTAVQVRLLALAPPGQPLTSPTTPGSFSGVVTGQTAGGNVSVHTPAGALSLSVPNPPPSGTQLLLSLVGDPRPPLPGTGTAEGSGTRFEALRDAAALLRSGDPAAAQRLSQALPQPNTQLGLAAAFFVGAMRQGKLDRWLGSQGIDALKTAGAGRSDLLSRLERDLSQPPGRTTDNAGNDWRVTTLPFLNQGEIEQIRLYMRDRSGEGPEDDGDGGPQAQRFVVEAEFSRIGPIQLEGLTSDRQVDVMVRTQKPLDHIAQDEIRALFADTITALGLTGRVDFRVVPAFDLTPPSAGTATGGLTV